MARELRPGLHWIQECGPDRSHFVSDRDPDWYESGRELHIPQNAYLLCGDRTLLFDTLSPASTETVLAELDAVLDGRGLDYLVVSHPDVPHAGNALAVLEEYPGAELVAPAYGDGHELYHLDEATLVGEGDRLDLGGLEVAFHEATFPDAPVHLWMTEATTGTLFPVDWFGYPHLDDECLLCADEFDRPLTEDRLVEFHGRVLFWYQYVDVPKVQAETRRVARAFDPEVLAPAHGNPVREGVGEYLELMEEVVATVRERGRVGALG
ncbi:MAG: MBL fold metallo-hydrolase [Halobacteriaceae archaeon]